MHMQWEITLVCQNMENLDAMYLLELGVCGLSPIECGDTCLVHSFVDMFSWFWHSGYCMFVADVWLAKHFRCSG